MMSADAIPSEWITTKEAAKLTGYSPGHIRQLIARDLSWPKTLSAP